MAYNDPRGPIRTIVEVKEERETVEGGVILKLKIKLDCGHFPDLNPIYSYRTGDSCRCYSCGKESK